MDILANPPQVQTDVSNSASFRSHVKIHDGAVIKKTKYGLFGRISRRKPLFSMAAWFQFSKMHLNKAEDF